MKFREAELKFFLSKKVCLNCKTTNSIKVENCRNCKSKSFRPKKQIQKK